MKKMIIGSLFFMIIAGIAAQTQTAYDTEADLAAVIEPLRAEKKWVEIRAICAAVKMYANLPAQVLAQAKYTESLMAFYLKDNEAALVGFADIAANHKTTRYAVGAHYMRASILYSQEKYTEVLAECDSGLDLVETLKPKIEQLCPVRELYSLKGWSYRRQGQEALATATFLEGTNRLINIYPANEYLFRALRPEDMTDEAYYGIVKKLIRAVAHDLSGLEDPSNEITKKKIAFLKRLRTILDVRE